MVIFLLVSKLQKSRKHKENHHLCKINRFFFFFPFWENSGLEMAGWLAGLGTGQAGWAGREAGWSWQLPGQPASRPSPARNFPKKEKKNN